MGLLSLFVKPGPAQQEPEVASASRPTHETERFIDHRSWPEPQLVPYRAIVAFSGCCGEVAMEPYVKRRILLPTHALGAIYDGGDVAAHADPVRVVPGGELLDGRREHLKRHTHLLRAWTRDWEFFHYVKECDVGGAGVVANVINLTYSASEGETNLTDVMSDSPCGIALEDGRIFQAASWWEHFLEHGEHYANNWDYLLHCARKEFKR